MGYATDTPTAVSADAAGDLMLLDNHEALVKVTAATACAPVVGAEAETAANLAVPFRGVDLGAKTLTLTLTLTLTRPLPLPLPLPLTLALALTRSTLAPTTAYSSG